MRKLVVFLIVMSTALATCDDYVASAVNDMNGTSCIYPQCFGAAGRYKEAATCYLMQGDQQAANAYFQKASDYYLQGITYIGPAGDYPLRAPSFEYAADMQAQLRDSALAAKYYDSAIGEYLKLGDAPAADAAAAKRAALSNPPQNATGFSVLAGNFLIGAVVIVIAIALFIYFRRPGEQPAGVASLPPARIESVETEPVSKEPVSSAKEKMRDKIRRKYGLA